MEVPKQNLVEIPRNMTGVYLGGFIHEGYLPPKEKKASVPPTFYRGHVVKLARTPKPNPHRSSVGRYPMHTLNSGFSGSKVPLKDQMNYKYPDTKKHVQRGRYKAKGKWCNYPMTIEVRKLAGNGASGNFLAECVINGPSPENGKRRAATAMSRDSHASSFIVTPSLYRDDGKDPFYQSMYDEIRQIVSRKPLSHGRINEKLENLLLNGRLSSVNSPTREHNPRADTSFEMIEDSTSAIPSPIARPSTISSMPITKQEKRVLLLPVPFISRHRVEVKQRPPTAHETSAANRAEVLSRLSTASAKMLPRVESVPPYYVSSLAERNMRDDFRAKSSQDNRKSKLSSSDRLTKLLNVSTEQEESLMNARHIFWNRNEMSSRKTTDTITAPHGSPTAGKPTSPSPINRTLRFSETNSTIQFVTSASNIQPSLSVVVPEAYNESISSSPVPGRLSVTSNRTGDDRLTIDEEEEDLARVNINMNDPSQDIAENNVSSDKEIKCIVQQDDGHTIPAPIYSGYDKANGWNMTKGVVAEIEMQAEAKRTELKQLILDHQQLVFYIGRLESPDALLETTI